MKFLYPSASILFLLLFSSCIANPTATASPTIGDGAIRFDLVLPTNEFHSFDEVNFQVVLTNQSDKSILVHSRLHYVSMYVPASISEMLILIFDSSGNRIVRQCDLNYAGPSIDTLEELQPGKQITQTLYLRDSCFFDDSLFTTGEKYAIVATYQNELDVTQTIDGVDVSSWVGSVQSNEVTFTIKP